MPSVQAYGDAMTGDAERTRDDDPGLRWFRGTKATDPSSLTSSDQPPHEVRTIIAQLWLSAAMVPVVGAGIPWLLTLASDGFPVAAAVVTSILSVAIAAWCAILALLLRRGSERTRRLLTWPHQEESVLDVVVLGGWWMLARDRLRTRRARAWFHHRTQQRLARRSGRADGTQGSQPGS